MLGFVFLFHFWFNVYKYSVPFPLRTQLVCLNSCIRFSISIHALALEEWGDSLWCHCRGWLRDRRPPGTPLKKMKIATRTDMATSSLVSTAIAQKHECDTLGHRYTSTHSHIDIQLARDSEVNSHDRYSLVLFSVKYIKTSCKYIPYMALHTYCILNGHWPRDNLSFSVVDIMLDLQQTNKNSEDYVVNKQSLAMSWSYLTCYSGSG